MPRHFFLSPPDLLQASEQALPGRGEPSQQSTASATIQSSWGWQTSTCWHFSVALGQMS